MPLDDFARETLPDQSFFSPDILDRFAPSDAASPPSHRRLNERDLFVLDLFRHLAVFRRHYDEHALSQAARHLELALGRERADDVMADAVLLDNEMRCQTDAAFASSTPGACQSSQSELDFVSFLNAVAGGSERAAMGACSRLGITDSRALLLYAKRLTRQLTRHESSEEATHKKSRRNVNAVSYPML